MFGKFHQFTCRSMNQSNCRITEKKECSGFPVVPAKLVFQEPVFFFKSNPFIFSRFFLLNNSTEFPLKFLSNNKKRPRFFFNYRKEPIFTEFFFKGKTRFSDEVETPFCSDEMDENW